VFNNVSSTDRTNLEALVMAFETNLAPIVGQQVTLTDQSESDSLERVDLLIERAGTAFVIPNEGTATECDLVVTGVVDDIPQSWLRRSDGSFESADGVISEAELLALAEVPGQPLTFTCAPPGSGPRMARVEPDGTGGTGGAGGDGGTGGDGGPSTGGSSGGCGCIVGASPLERPSGGAVVVVMLIGFALVRRRRRR
jgi:MYXO-CTERM domain-containing protein